MHVKISGGSKNINKEFNCGILSVNGNVQEIFNSDRFDSASDVFKFLTNKFDKDGKEINEEIYYGFYSIPQKEKVGEKK